MSRTAKLIERILEHNSLETWASALLVVLCVFLGGIAIRGFVRRHYKRMLLTERLEIMELPAEVASKTSSLFLLVMALTAGASLLKLPKVAAELVPKVFTVIGFWQLGVWSSTAVIAWITLRRNAVLETNRAAAGSIGIIGVVLRALVWGLVLLLALDNLGVDITALVAGLGVGGIAVALAVQNVLGDLFASLSITLDRPFVLGDFVIVGDYMGNVERIGVKSTRLRSLGGEQIIVSNADLLNSRVRNYGQMNERRVLFTLGVTYETPRAKLERIPAIVREIIERQQRTRFDRCHFAKYGDFALSFEAVYYVLSPDYNLYMDIQQAINFAIHEAFENAQIEFAYPTQKLWMAQVATESSAKAAE